LTDTTARGLAQGDFELALRGLLGEGAPLSPSSIERLRGKWVSEFEAWSRRSLRGPEPVYLWADGIYVKAGLEKDKAALLVIVAGLRDGRKVVLAVESGHRESAEAWSRLLRDLRARGMSVPRLVIADGHLGIWSALSQVLPEVAEQRCWNHKLVNVLDALPKKLQAEVRELLCRIPYAPTRSEAERLREQFRARYAQQHLDHPELLPEVAEGATYEDGVRVVRTEPETVEAPPDDVYTPIDVTSLIGAFTMGGSETDLERGQLRDSCGTVSPNFCPLTAMPTPKP
jgi:hypothetical protein